MEAVDAVPVNAEISAESGLPVPPTTPLIKLVKLDNAELALVPAVLAVDAVPVRLEISVDNGFVVPPVTPLINS